MSSNISDSLSLTGKKWALCTPDEPQVNLFMRQLEIPEMLARLLTFRVPSLEEARKFLSPTLKDSLPDPLVLKDMDHAIDRVVQAITHQEKILVWGDYDVDGITSIVLLLRFFASLGKDVSFYVPPRTNGYGATASSLDEVLTRGDTISLILMVDCGTTAHGTLEQLQSRGIDVVILDHHTPEETLPSVCAIVNPHLPGNPEELKKCCAVGIVFLFLVGLNRVLRTKIEHYPEPDLRLLLDLVALGTVCDVVPLVTLNRAYVAQGIKIVNKRTNLGIRELVHVSKLLTEVSVYHLAFFLGPRLNAPGRLDNANPSVRLLTTQTEKEAVHLAAELDRLNQERRALEDQVMEEAHRSAEEQKDQPFLIITGKEWATGVLGIIAGRLRERFDKPCCVISFDEKGFGRGSGRSVLGLDLGEAIHRAKTEGLIEDGGGHAFAAGFSLWHARLEDLKCFLRERAGGIAASPPMTIDSTLSLSGATLTLVHLIKRLSPFGAGNPPPRFLFPHVFCEQAQRVGRGHLSCVLTQNDGMRVFALAFRSVGTPLEKALCSPSCPYDVVGTLESSVWRKKETIQIHIIDVGTRS
ncbi:MAG: single-stranded-DNA-specific exonuclease RecJ [Holosporales bacterium]|nr:single-stranded-DNA-specific exonuclease RecJ [Holosporales bacterium]